MTRWPGVLIIGALAFVLAACGGHKASSSSGSGQATSSPIAGVGGLACGSVAPVSYGSAWANKIVYQGGGSDSTQPGVSLINPDGSGSTPIFSGDVLGTAMSRDGRKVAFSSSQDNNKTRAIYVVDDSGAPAKAVTPAGRFDRAMDWSPDGKSLVFATGFAGKSDLYRIALDGTGLVRLGEGDTPAWSPGGGCVAFVSSRSGASKVYLMAADGSGQVRLTNQASKESAPIWSPDGRTLAFSCDIDLCVASADGSGLRHLTSGQEAMPQAWSPDGKRIAFLNGGTIWSINADGTGRLQLTNNGLINGSPSFSPDGKQIAFTGANQCGPCAPGATKYNGLHVENADGSTQMPAQTFRVAGGFPLWSPIPAKSK